MNITILTIGSRGDVQPFVALGLGLKRAGHKVCLASPIDFKNLVINYGLDFYPIEGNMQMILNDDSIVESIESGKNMKFFKALQSKQNIKKIIQDVLSACKDSDFIVSGNMILFLGACAMEKMNIPGCIGLAIPNAATAEFPHPLFPQSTPFGSLYNRMTYKISDLLIKMILPRIGNPIRKAMGLSPLDKKTFQNLSKIPILYAYSKHIIQKPLDWNELQHVTGYWFLDSPTDWTPSGDLIDFLQSGKKPVYIGFGSMTTKNSKKVGKLMIEALIQTRERAVIQRGWAGLNIPTLANTIFMVDEIPYGWLFPHVAAVVHHGGAGTTAEGLRAGCPTIVIPFLGDQPFWGNRVYCSGAGTRPIPFKQLNAEKLANAIKEATTNIRIKKQAETLSKNIYSENGIQSAVELIEYYGQQ